MAQKKYLDYTQLSTFLANLRGAFSAKSHTHKKADITDFPTTMKNPSSLTVKTNGTTKATYDGSSALSVDITAANVGAASVGHTHDDRYYTETEMDSKLAAKENTVTQSSVNKFINMLGTGEQTPTDNDYYISQYVGGGTTTTTFHRRPVSALWSYIKSKADGVYAAKSHTHDDRYYTETEINSKVDTINASIDSKAAKSHKHSAADITSGTLSSDRLPSIPVSKLDGVINASNLPSYVDDVLEYENKTSFPTTGEAGKIYVDKDTNLTYRWSGTAYVEISPSLALGETSSTAFAGDKGKVAYDHSQKTGNPHRTKIADISNLQSTLDAKVPSSRKVNGKALSADITLAKGDVGLGNVDNTADANKSVNSAKSASTLTAVTTSGDGAAYTATVPGITALTAGANFVMIPHTQSTSANATLNVNGLGAKNLRVQLSNSSATAVAAVHAYFLGANKPVRVIYNGSFWVVQLIRPDANTIYGTVKIENGGTGAKTAAEARTNLGISTANGTVLSQNADYAEVGQWADGNTSDENRIGYFVAIDSSSAGSTMVKATSTADVRGVTVTSPAFSGNCSSDKFDESGNLLKQYDYVAVMGLVSVIDNGKCTVNGRCMPTNDGTAVPSSNNLGYQVVDRIDTTHVLIAIEPGADMVKRIKDDVTSLQSGKANVSHTHTKSQITDFAHTHDDRYYTKNEVDAKKYIASLGNKDAETGKTSPSVGGLSMQQAYNNSYPETYGNILNLNGMGQGQILVSWAGNGQTPSSHMHFRGKTDGNVGDWSSWYKVYTTGDKPTKSDVGLGNVDNTADSAKSVKYATSAGSATTSTKLTTSAGSATQPVYFSDGKPVATTYTLGASVPSGAKFTDTVYSLPTASTSTLGGVKVDGKTITINNGVISAASQGVTLAQLKTILASAAINSDGKLTFTI